MRVRTLEAEFRHALEYAVRYVVRMRKKDRGPELQVAAEAWSPNKQALASLESAFAQSAQPFGCHRTSGARAGSLPPPNAPLMGWPPSPIAKQIGLRPTNDVVASCHLLRQHGRRVRLPGLSEAFTIDFSIVKQRTKHRLCWDTQTIERWQ